MNARPATTRFVLVRTSHAGNVGSAARAIKVMGFNELVLVAPRHPDVLRQDEALAMASGATDVLDNARVVASLAQALEGIEHVCATAMTPRDFGPPTAAPRDHFAAWAVQQAVPDIAFVFGSERFGLSNDDVYRCHQCLSIPAAPGYGSLNLAQAVQLIAYEWRQALGGYDVVERRAEPKIATAPDVQRLLEHWRSVLVAIGYLDPNAPKKLMPRLNQALNRARVTPEEVHILRGIARAIEATRDTTRDTTRGMGMARHDE